MNIEKDLLNKIEDLTITMARTTQRLQKIVRFGLVSTDTSQSPAIIYCHGNKLLEEIENLRNEIDIVEEAILLQKSNQST